MTEFKLIRLIRPSMCSRCMAWTIGERWCCVGSCVASNWRRSLPSCHRRRWCWRHAAARITGAAC